ncbi:DUF2516 family protein [Klenkia taihuensis]|uniref:DUF2516 domain-containing protein n=1 Tax=Klenkia taihuensis TaxID=1225127 RepID=A0A1I1JD69_9ACTN|nr:DUF2516 family protein [Klenkia taihuensis]GHE11119.1 membrane protein [Klenkia taihuensis]SFC43380.1 Protein of unknown function [Klenkia taihuensis]
MAGFDNAVFAVILYAVLALGAWATVDAIIRPAAGYVATGKLSKPAWVAITAIATLVVYAFGVLSFLGLPAIVAIIVYLVDVRPALRGLQSGNSSW